MDYKKRLKEVADKHGLTFIDASLKRSNSREMTFVRNIVAHSYGIKRQQSSEAIIGYVDQDNPYAHIYINTGRFKYLILMCDIHKRAVHVRDRNVDTVGIEMNEVDGSYEISPETVEVFDEVCEVIRSEFGKSLPIISHRLCTGKDCPKGYYHFSEFTKKLTLGEYGLDSK